MACAVAFVTKAAGVTLTCYTAANNKPGKGAYLKDNAGLGDQTIIAVSAVKNYFHVPILPRFLAWERLP